MLHTAENRELEFSTADLFDAYTDRVEVCESPFRNFGLKRTFRGQCQTLKVFEDHNPVRAALSANGNGRILVVDGEGSLRVGIAGDGMAALGLQNGWAGMIVFGAIRDSAVLERMNFGMKALGTTARRSQSKTQGHLDLPLKFGSVTFNTGDWVYADPDSVLVSRSELDLASI